MKKTVIGISLLMAGLFGSQMMALTTATTPDAKQCPNKEQCAKQGKGRKGECPNPFASLNLTADQQTKLNALKEEQQKAREAKMAQKKEQKAEKKEQKAQDREAARAAKVQAKKDYLGKVKEILTPEQYVEFLEVSFVNAQPQQKGMKPGKDGRGKKGAAVGQGKPGRDGKAGKMAGKAGKRADMKVRQAAPAQAQ